MDLNEVSEFLRLLAHDLQNQIGAIDLNLQIMPTLLPPGDPALQTLDPFFVRASTSASEMSETISDLQVYAYGLLKRRDASSSDLTELDLNRKLKDCALALASRARLREVDIEVDLIASEPIFACAVEDEVLGALRLLASEGLRSSFPGAKLKLRTGVNSEARPFIEIETSQAGIFDTSRSTLALFLARAALRHSQVAFLDQASESSSILRLVFRAAI